MVFRRAAVGALAFLVLWAAPANAEKLRISPDDLKLRVEVSQELSPATRREITELARTVPLPVTDGLLQTEDIFQQKFGNRGWSEKLQTLSRYYFFVARLEQSKKFSEEFARREQQLKLGIELLGKYIDEINPYVARAGYPDVAPVELEKVQDFPLSEVGPVDGSGLRVLHLFPQPKMSMGRENLRGIRQTAETERNLLRDRLSDLHKAQRAFLNEVHLVGEELIAQRGPVKEWVKQSRAGLPFSL